jgi:hypothetical protein
MCRAPFGNNHSVDRPEIVAVADEFVRLQGRQTEEPARIADRVRLKTVRTEHGIGERDGERRRVPAHPPPLAAGYRLDLHEQADGAGMVIENLRKPFEPSPAQLGWIGRIDANKFGGSDFGQRPVFHGELPRLPRDGNTFESLPVPDAPT